MRSKEEILQEINALENKFDKSRNIVEKARLAAQVKELKDELNSLEYQTEKSVVVQNDAPSVADHKESRRIVRGDITNAGESFVGII